MSWQTRIIDDLGMKIYTSSFVSICPRMWQIKYLKCQAFYMNIVLNPHTWFPDLNLFLYSIQVKSLVNMKLQPAL
uniref:Uncharacterized protein n=1 Tax=Rhizophora mucronata TaxID=61149 RepID=A0A2P2QJH1_RHIMU